MENNINIATQVAQADLRSSLLPGTVRKAENKEEAELGELLFDCVEGLGALCALLKLEPEKVVVVKNPGCSWNDLLEAIYKSGASSTCRVLVTS